MHEAARILEQIEQGDGGAAHQLLPLVYRELRTLAARKLAQEQPGQTLQATGLVHEAYLRLVGDQRFDSCGHFFAAAAEAMRRILVESARRKKSVKHGGELQRNASNLDDIDAPTPSVDLLLLNEALDRLAEESPACAELVKLRYFAGLTMAEAAKAMGLSLATAERRWTYARTWLFAELNPR